MSAGFMPGAIPSNASSSAAPAPGPVATPARSGSSEEARFLTAFLDALRRGGSAPVDASGVETDADLLARLLGSLSQADETELADVATDASGPRPGSMTVPAGGAGARAHESAAGLDASAGRATSAELDASREVDASPGAPVAYTMRSMLDREAAVRDAAPARAEEGEATPPSPTGSEAAQPTVARSDDVRTVATSPAASAMAPTDVETPNRNLDELDPALRERVDRVIERMRAEFGHVVTVVEGYRSTERQEHLYAQGRTEPGPVRTWTQRSWHSEGLAADLLVDGTYDDPLAYARLQRIAREEGLRTLGSRDRGHVELPGVRPTQEAIDAGTDAVSGPRYVGVARPAQVALPAPVARVATPGSWAVEAPLPEAPAPLASPVVADRGASGSEAPLETRIAQVVGVQLAGRGGQERHAPVLPPAGALDASDADALGSAGRQPDGSARDEAPEGRLPTDRRALVAAPGEGIGTAATAVRRAGPVTGPSSLDGFERVQELQDLARTIRPTRVSVRLGEAGGEQIRVGLVDRVVDAALDLDDPVRAASLRDRVADLHRALEQRGLELGALNVATSSLGAGLQPVAPGDAAAELIRTVFTSSGEGGRDAAPREQSNSQDRPTDRGGSRSERGRRDREEERN